MADENSPDEPDEIENIPAGSRDEWDGVPVAQGPRDGLPSVLADVPPRETLEDERPDVASLPETGVSAVSVDAPEPDSEPPTVSENYDADAEYVEVEEPADWLEEVVRDALKAPENQSNEEETTNGPIR